MDMYDSFCFCFQIIVFSMNFHLNIDKNLILTSMEEVQIFIDKVPKSQLCTTLRI